MSHRNIARLVFLLVSLLAFTAGAVPVEINHEGLLIGDDGLPMEGEISLRVALHDAAEGGVPLWFEDYQVMLMDGYYRVSLGSNDPTLSDHFDGQDRYLAFTVNNVALTPRHMVLSVPYARVAEDAVGDIHPRTVSVGGREVINAEGRWVGLGGGEGEGEGEGEAGYSTPAELLAALITVDGTRSALDADRLDGMDSSEFATTGIQVRDLLLTADGPNSGVDADRLDTLDSAQFMRTDEDTGTVGDLLVLGHVITMDPVDPDHVATKAYVDANAGGGGGDMLGRVCPAGHAVRGYEADGSISCVDVISPVVLGADPPWGRAAGGEQVTIWGSNFQDGARLFFGLAEAEDVVVVDANTITATTTEAEGGGLRVAISVLNPTGVGGTLPNGFNYGLDVDGDGIANQNDCRPFEAAIFPGNPDDDLCDGVDSDCDDETDEDYEDAECHVGGGLQGLCDVGESRCANGVLSCLQVNQPAPEICDELDNNCNGEVDEGLQCLYTFEGVRTDVPEADLFGWQRCWRGEYNQSNPSIASILADCPGDRLLLACRQIGQANFLVAAMGDRADVTHDCGNNNACVHEANGVGWYFSDSYSWGFVVAGEPVSRNSCDTNDSRAETRICWHTGGGNMNSGWRCGANRGVGGGWERFVYTPGAAPAPQ